MIFVPKSRKFTSKFDLSARNRKVQFKHDSFSRRNKTKFNLVLHKGTTVRSFASTPSSKIDPIWSTALAFATPYSPSVLANPLAGAFILLMGMAVTLFFLVSTLPRFFAGDPSYAEIIRNLDNILSLLETFLAYEQSGVNIMLTNLNNFSPEILTNYYSILQELVTVRESLYIKLDRLVNSPNIVFIERPIIDRVNEIYENYRLGGNNLMNLVRNIENRLNIPEQERIPSFWFEA